MQLSPVPHVDKLGVVGPRRGVSTRRTVLFLALGAAGVFSSSPASAQQNPKDGEFSIQRFDPAPGPRNYFTTRGVRTDGQNAWSAGFVANYAANPFVVVSCNSLTDCNSPNAQQPRNVNVVDKVITGDLLGSYTPIPRLQLGLKIPVSFVHGDGLSPTGSPVVGGVSGAGLGDVQLEGKFRAYGEVKDPFVVGVGAFVTAPLGHATADGKYIGNSTPTGGLRGIFDGRQGPFSFGGNLTAVFSGDARVGSTTIGPAEFRYGIGAGFEASPIVRVMLDAFGGTKFSSKAGTNSMEIDGGGMITPLNSPVGVLLGGGAGVIEGVGVPTFRAFLGVTYTHEVRDRDGDGIPDDKDQCPTVPEDKDGFEDTDGCPDPDNDGDTILDKDDKCPNQAEDADGFQDTDGCPDPDNDGDGVPDDKDQCPDKKETINGYKDDDGCPDEPDRDGDGVPDAKDQCPDQPEDTDGFQDTDGCPDPDNDNDGIKDEDDECVDEAEDIDGYQDEDGCPEGGKNGAGKKGDKDKSGAKPADKKGDKAAPAAAPAPAAPAAKPAK